MLREIANAFKGEMELELYHFSYMMRVNLDVIAKFNSETGEDLQCLGVRALRAYDDSKRAPTFWARQEMMNSAVRMDHAAWLFYLAAHEVNSKVEFEEIQDALIRIAIDGANDGSDGNPADITPSYAIMFVQLMTLVLCGPVDDVKKNLETLTDPTSSEASLAPH